MEKSMGLLFYLKKRKHDPADEVPIYFRITVDGIKKEICTKLRADSTKWSAQAQRLSGRTDAAKAVNDYLDILYTKAIQARTQLTALDKPVTADHITALVQGQPLEQYMLMDIFTEHNKKMKQLVGVDYAEGTMEKYERTCRHTLAFLQHTYRVTNMDIQKLDYSFIVDFEHWFKTVRQCEHNTTMKYLGYFKKVVLYCIKKRWLTFDPFAEYRMTKRKKRRTPLSQLELDNLASKKFSSERLTTIRDIFLFSCYTGLAYADVKKLKQTDIFIGVDGYKWITCLRQKTERHNSMSNIPLLPAAEEIIRRYADTPECTRTGVVLPVKSNQKTNEYLKEIADLCGIQTNLTFHIARHTFATTVTLANKVPIETVSRMLAHQKLSTTQEYAQVLDDKVSLDMSGLRIKYGNT